MIRESSWAYDWVDVVATVACAILVVSYAWGRFTNNLPPKGISTGRLWLGFLVYMITFLMIYAALLWFFQFVPVPLYREALPSSIAPLLAGFLTITGTNVEPFRSFESQIRSAILPEMPLISVSGSLSEVRGTSPANLSKVEQTLAQRAKLNPEDALVVGRLTVISEIDERVESLRRRTSGILAIAGWALVVAAIIVIFAGRLTSIDATAVSNVDKLKSEVADEQKLLGRLYQLQSLSKQLDELKQRSASTDAIERQIASIRDPNLGTVQIQYATCHLLQLEA
jgi:hypothetical protein